MLAALLAMLAAVGFATSAVASKKGLQYISPLGGLFISLPAGVVVALVVAIVDWPEKVSPRAIAFFALAGLFGAGIGRLLVISGLHRLSTTIYVPLQTGAHPLIGVTGGLILFREEVSFARTLGAVGIVAGIWVLTRSERAPSLADSRRAVGERCRRTSGIGIALLFPIGAGLSFGLADLTTKEAMGELPLPAFGAMLSITTASVVWSLVALSSRSIRAQVRLGRGKHWFILHGALSTFAVISAAAALRRGDVSLVSPIVASQPFVVLLLSAMFLRRIEVVTRTAVVGSILVVAGASLVSVS